ncbi:carbohydrate ABC transporter permease [Cryptosporangium minutisporangium]|uniref:Carbohydrate ABC transporter permease n=1 Tax=Cryptosporangium minutisporangium TaxID=113569 RepID=A0ABP6T5C6_9ACTN
MSTVAAASTTQTPPVAVVDTMSGRVKKRLTSRTATVVSLLIAVLWTIPTFGLLLSSFRPEREIKTTGWWTAFTNPSFTLENYENVLFGTSSTQLLSYFVNSIVIAVPATIFALTLAALAAYALAWIDFKGRNWVFIGIFALQIVPLQMALIPLLQLFSNGAHIGSITIVPDLNLTGSFVTVWLAHTAFGLPLGVFLLHNFISEIPKEMVEAARVDGAGHGAIFRKLMLPLITPALASFGIFEFLWIWNDLLVALTFTGGTKDVAPLTVRLAEMAGSRGDRWERLTAGAFVSLIIPLIVFLSLQKYFVRGLLAGGLKG